MSNRPEISVVVPMHNEAENLPGAIDRIREAMAVLMRPFEIVAVDDGSTDTTRERLDVMCSEDPRIRVVSYPLNRGRGYALRRGFNAARGAIVATIDADLSYSPEHIPALVQVLDGNPDVDFVVGSPYAREGHTEGVPTGRLWISKLGNRVLGLAMPGRLTAVTGILRAYRRHVLDVLDLESTGKEIHLEIVSKAIAAGFVPAEMPATLTGRRRGKSKFLLRATVASHLIFSFYEKPIMLFGLIGALVLGLGFGSGLNLIYLWRQGTLNPNRPLVSLTVILLVAGLQIILFGFLGSQIVQVRRELYRTQKAIKLQGMHRAPDAAHDSPAPHAAHPRQSTEPHSVERAAG